MRGAAAPAASSQGGEASEADPSRRATDKERTLGIRRPTDKEAALGEARREVSLAGREMVSALADA